MKICSSCGAMVADNVDICPDCGMEFEGSASASPSATPATPAIGNGSGFTVDFGYSAPPAPAPVPASIPAPTPVSNPIPAATNSNFADMDFGAPPSDPFDFSPSGGTIQLDKTPAEPSAPVAPAAAPSASAKIALKRGGVLSGETFVFGPGAIIGRFDPDSGPVDIDLGPLPESIYISRHHAEFRYDAGNSGWYVKDMGSSNGTFWRAGGQGAFSRLASEQALQPGDEISLGNARFEFQRS